MSTFNIQYPVSFSFNVVTEYDKMLLSNTLEVCETLDIDVLSTTDCKDYNTKLSFTNIRDENYINEIWQSLQCGWTVDELIERYFAEDLAKFYP